MNNIEIFPYLSNVAARMDWSSREVLRDFHGAPHLLQRIELMGPDFGASALEPIVRIGRLRARLVEITPDGLKVRAYFDQPLPESGAITFGYEDGVLYRFPREFDREDLQPMDRERIPENVRFPDEQGSLLTSSAS